LLALTRLGVVTLSGRNPVLPPELAVSTVMTDIVYPYAAKRVVLVEKRWITGDGKPIDAQHIHDAAPDDVCRIVLTSGTTGDGKAVALTHRMLMARIARHHYCFGSRLPYCQRSFIDLGFATSLGFQYLMAMLMRGGALFMPGIDQDSTIRAFEVYGIENILSSPYGLMQLMRAFESRPQLQFSLKTIFSGGSPMPASLSARLRERVCTHLITAYGSTETSMVASALSSAVADTPGAAGYILPGITVEAVDAAGIALPAGKEGVVRIRSLNGVDRYVGNPAASGEVFRDGWFYPGDIGYLTAQRLLVITGRQQIVLNLGGDKINPEMIETVLAAHANVVDAAVFTKSNELGVDEVWALVVARASFDADAIRRHCAAELPLIFVPVRVLETKQVPRNAMGKIERSRLPDLARTSLN
ncbi:MAG: class I adenylate-forming enzyme family protein, partial [Candidatus Binataceae bacterium]